MKTIAKALSKIRRKSDTSANATPDADFAAIVALWLELFAAKICKEGYAVDEFARPCKEEDVAELLLQIKANNVAVPKHDNPRIIWAAIIKALAERTPVFSLSQCTRLKSNSPSSMLAVTNELSSAYQTLLGALFATLALLVSHNYYDPISRITLNDAANALVFLDEPEEKLQVLSNLGASSDKLFSYYHTHLQKCKLATPPATKVNKEDVWISCANDAGSMAGGSAVASSKGSTKGPSESQKSALSRTSSKSNVDIANRYMSDRNFLAKRVSEKQLGQTLEPESSPGTISDPLLRDSDDDDFDEERMRNVSDAQNTLGGSKSTLSPSQMSAHTSSPPSRSPLKASASGDENDYGGDKVVLFGDARSTPGRTGTDVYSRALQSSNTPTLTNKKTHGQRGGALSPQLDEMEDIEVMQSNVDKSSLSQIPYRRQGSDFDYTLQSSVNYHRSTSYDSPGGRNTRSNSGGDAHNKAQSAYDNMLNSDAGSNEDFVPAEKSLTATGSWVTAERQSVDASLMQSKSKNTVTQTSTAASASYASIADDFDDDDDDTSKSHAITIEELQEVFEKCRLQYDTDTERTARSAHSKMARQVTMPSQIFPDTAVADHMSLVRYVFVYTYMCVCNRVYDFATSHVYVRLHGCVFTLLKGTCDGR